MSQAPPPLIGHVVMGAEIRDQQVREELDSIWEDTKRLIPNRWKPKGPRLPYVVRVKTVMEGINLYDRQTMAKANTFEAALGKIIKDDELPKLSLGYRWTQPGLVWVGLAGPTQNLKALEDHTQKALAFMAYLATEGWPITLKHRTLTHLPICNFDPEFTQELNQALADTPIEHHSTFEFKGLHLIFIPPP